MARELRFLIISLGNPAPYYNAVHSAGHHVLNSLPSAIGRHQPKFSRQEIGGKQCLASMGQKYMLVQSPAFMNDSGSFVSPAWKEIVGQASDPSSLGLVLVHDDLEVRLGQTKWREWAGSAKGHNGVRHVHGRLERTLYRSSPWGRYSVGIGRPELSKGGSVRSYVLQTMGQHMRDLFGKVGPPGLLSHLQTVEEKWLEEQSQDGREP